LWRDFSTPPGEASEWPTAVVAAALGRRGADRGVLERAAGALLATQRADGGWAYNEDVPTDADSTASVLLFLGGPGRRVVEDHALARRRAAHVLLRHQQPSGGIVTYAEPEAIRTFMGVGRWVRFRGWSRPHAEVTALGGLALLASHPAAARAAWSVVRRQQRSDGSWRSYWWASPLYATLQAVRLGGALGERAALNRAAAWVLRTRSAEEAQAGPFATALALGILVEAGLRGSPAERAADSLLAQQDGDGGWPSEPIMRVPRPGDVDPDRWRPVRLGGGIVVSDQHRTFTTATCVASLARLQRSDD
jgi:squalene cyclase